MNVYRMLTTGLCIAITFLSLPANASPQKELHFNVYLDDRKIGYHRFQLSDQGGTHHVMSEARFDVTFFKIPFYTYTHKNVEVWKGECLKKIRAVTDDNGEHFEIEGSLQNSIFQIKTLDEIKKLPACISTFAYWDKSFLNNRQLLNTQTGEYIDVTSRFLGEETMTIGQQQMPAHRYQVTAKDININLWYSGEDDWLALESMTESGKILRYTIE